MRKFKLPLLILLLLWMPFSAAGIRKFAIVSMHARTYYKVIDTAGNLLVDSILAPTGIDCYGRIRYDDGVFRFRQAGKIGYKDINNRIVLPAICEDAGDFVNGVGVATVRGRMGLIGRSGKWRIAPQYSWLTHADTSGTFLAVDTAGLLSLLSIQGQPIRKLQYRPYTRQPRFSAGLLPVTYGTVSGPSSAGAKVGFIDHSGRLAIDMVWETDAGMWYDLRSRAYRDMPDICPTGRARREADFSRQPHAVAHDYYRFAGGRALVRRGGQNIVINEAGDSLFSMPQALEHIHNSGGFFFCTEANAAGPRFPTLQVVYNRSGRIIWRSELAPKSAFADGFMVVAEGREDQVFLDTAGNKAFGGRRFMAAHGFESGLARVVYRDSSENGGKGTVVSGMLRPDGSILRSDSIDLRIESDNGWRKLQTRSGEGFVNNSGAVTIPPQYIYLTRFRNGYCGFRKRDRFGTSGYINEQNHVVIPETYEDVWDFETLRAD